MSKIIAVWGGKQSGKTTFAVNLACALSKRDVLVGLISSNLTYGELQTFFGQEVLPQKGLFKALNTETPNIGEKFTAYTESKNLFFLSTLPNTADCFAIPWPLRTRSGCSTPPPCV